MYEIFVNEIYLGARSTYMKAWLYVEGILCVDGSAVRYTSVRKDGAVVWLVEGRREYFGTGARKRLSYLRHPASRG